MSRIDATFARLQSEQRKALIPFITAGDPSKELTVPLMHTLVANGADVIELGVPFSDPMADGPVIQRSSERALKHHTSIKDVLGFAKEFRQKNNQTPIVMMGYANPVERMGLTNFAQAAKAAGVDGVIIVDYPPEESADLLAAMDAVGIATIYLLSPTSSAERIALVAKSARGYIYYVSLKGVTGAAHIDAAEVGAAIARIRQQCALPIGVGFGIRDGATAKRLAEVADAVVIGSRIIQEMENAEPGKTLERVGALLGDIRKVMDT